MLQNAVFIRVFTFAKTNTLDEDVHFLLGNYNLWPLNILLKIYKYQNSNNIVNYINQEYLSYPPLYVVVKTSRTNFTMLNQSIFDN